MANVYYKNENGFFKKFSYVYKNNQVEADDTVYSDRLFQWNHQKHDELCKKHFGNCGQYWNNRKSDDIENFLKDYTDNPNLILCSVEELENASNGYPYWRFNYKK